MVGVLCCFLLFSFLRYPSSVSLVVFFFSALFQSSVASLFLHCVSFQFRFPLSLSTLTLSLAHSITDTTLDTISSLSSLSVTLSRFNSDSIVLLRTDSYERRPSLHLLLQLLQPTPFIGYVDESPNLPPSTIPYPIQTYIPTIRLQYNVLLKVILLLRILFRLPACIPLSSLR